MQEKDIWQLLEQVKDPEIPVLSVVDLGIIRSVEVSDNNKIHVVITPTYTGCPAMNAIETSIKLMLAGYQYDATVETKLSPAWTTDWISNVGKQKLKQYGIAPPQEQEEADANKLFATLKGIICPLCNSNDTTQISQFGSTACKSLFRCNACLETFDYFKCHR